MLRHCHRTLAHYMYNSLFTDNKNLSKSACTLANFCTIFLPFFLFCKNIFILLSLGGYVILRNRLTLFSWLVLGCSVVLFVKKSLIKKRKMIRKNNNNKI